MFKEFWEGLAPSSRRGLVAGVLVVISLTLALAWWSLKVDYALLFGDLSPGDAAAMTNELDRLKVPYRLGADGTSILVSETQVPATRLKLMSKDIPLHGAVGFELFNNADLGMTEFAQKINYQRALQGELTRTILSLDEVASARVHLALPEEGLFRHEQQKAKAAVTLAMKPGQALHADEVAGIQRLVAASVTGIAPADVTIVDEHGVALTRATIGSDGGDDGAATDLRRDVEQALARKASAILDKALGVGRAAVSVDATLDMNQVRVTQEDVTHPAPVDGDAPSGVVVRQRESTQDTAASALAHDASGGTTTQRETEYQVGRRVQQVVSQPGSIQRLHVVAVVQGTLDAGQIEQVRALLGAAVGASPERGDQVLVQVAQAVQGSAAPASTNAAAPTVLRADATPKPSASAGLSADRVVVQALLAALVLAALGATALMLRRRPQPPVSRIEPMTEDQRRAALTRVQEWLATGEGAVVDPGARNGR